MLQEQPTKRVIDRMELGRRIREKRTELRLTQNELASIVDVEGLKVGFISQLEVGGVAFRKEYHLPWTRAICRELGIEIPFLGENYLPKGARTRALEIDDEPEPQVDIGADDDDGITEDRPGARDAVEIVDGDPELDVIQTCSSELARLPNRAQRSRVLDYLGQRYVDDEDAASLVCDDAQIR